MSYEDEIAKIMEQASADVVNVICSRLESIGELSYTDAIKLANLSRTNDLKAINKILADATDKSAEEIDKIVEDASKKNKTLAEQFYKYRGMQNTVETATLLAIKERAKKSMKRDVLNLANTSAFVIRGKKKSIQKAYNEAVNKGIFATQQGLTDYNTAIKQTVKQLADSGLRTVDFASGYSRRLDSQVRMNILDGMRQFNMDYRNQQGEEFGADGVEVDAHGLCAKDHLPVQGRQYSKIVFAQLQESLDRPIGTMNCHHITRPIIMGISKPTYSNEDLQRMEYYSNEPVTYTDKRGNEHTISRYEASQRQRVQETNIRRLKDERNAYKQYGNDLAVKQTEKKIRENTKYYNKLSSEVGLTPKRNRLQVAKIKY